MKAKKLIEETVWGDRAAAKKLRELLKDDDEAWEEVLRKLRSPACEPDGKEREAFWAELRDVVALIDSKPTSGESRLAELRERAWRYGSCERVQVLGVDAARRRLIGKLDEAEALLERARDVAEGCRLLRDDANPCLLDVGRRRSILLAALGRHEAALAEAETVIDGYRRLGGPGHDLDGQGLANALFARGAVRFVMEDAAGASADFAESLAMVPPALNELHETIQYDLAVALSKTDAAGKKKAEVLLTRLRRSFSQRPLSVQRNYFDWLDGMLGWEVRRINRHRARKKLHRAQEAFFDPLHMPDQFVAATGDLLLLYFPDRKKMREVLERAKRVGKGFITDPEQWRRLCELEKLVDAGVWTPHDELESAVRGFRDAVSGIPGILPSLIRSRASD